MIYLCIDKCKDRCNNSISKKKRKEGKRKIVKTNRKKRAKVQNYYGRCIVWCLEIEARAIRPRCVSTPTNICQRCNGKSDIERWCVYTMEKLDFRDIGIDNHDGYLYHAR